MSTLAKTARTRNNPKEACECGCNRVFSLHKVAFIYPHPSAQARQMVAIEHAAAYRDELESLRQLNDLVQGLRKWVWWRRIKPSKRVRLLSYRSRVRLQGEETATREAKRAALLSWLPMWIGVPLADRWDRGQTEQPL